MQLFLSIKAVVAPEFFCFWGALRGKMCIWGGKNPKNCQKWLIFAIFPFRLGGAKPPGGANAPLCSPLMPPLHKGNLTGSCTNADACTTLITCTAPAAFAVMDLKRVAPIIFAAIGACPPPLFLQRQGTWLCVVAHALPIFFLKLFAPPPRKFLDFLSLLCPGLFYWFTMK